MRAARPRDDRDGLDYRLDLWELETPGPPLGSGGRCVGPSWKGAGVSDLTDVRSLKTFGSFDDLELYAISFGQ